MRILACPARFERATSALEAGKMRLNNKLNNGLSLAKKGVQYALEPWCRVETIGFGMASAGVPRFSVKFVGLTDKT